MRKAAPASPLAGAGLIAITYPATMAEPPRPDRAPIWSRPAYLLGGLVALGLGVIGIFVPLLPTVPFLLVAAWCFARSSHRLHRWLLAHPRLGPMIAPFQGGRGMPRHAKVALLITMAVLFAVTFVWLVHGWIPYLILGAGAVISFGAVARIPTHRHGEEEAGGGKPEVPAP